MSGGELFTHLYQRDHFTEAEVRVYIGEIILALEHLHQLGIIYRDIKLENILLDSNGHIVLTDFGLSKEFKPHETDLRTYSFCGTIEYMAPEVVRGGSIGHTFAVDWWSVGVLTYELLTGASPFTVEGERNTQTEISRRILKSHPPIPDFMSPAVQDFIKRLLVKDPNKRLGGGSEDAAELKRHAFFKDINWSLLAAKKTPAPFVPKISGAFDVSNFAEEFTSMIPITDPEPCVSHLAPLSSTHDTSICTINGNTSNSNCSISSNSNANSNNNNNNNIQSSSNCATASNVQWDDSLFDGYSYVSDSIPYTNVTSNVQSIVTVNDASSNVSLINDVEDDTDDADEIVKDEFYAFSSMSSLYMDQSSSTECESVLQSEASSLQLTDESLIDSIVSSDKIDKLSKNRPTLSDNNVIRYHHRHHHLLHHHLQSNLKSEGTNRKNTALLPNSLDGHSNSSSTSSSTSSSSVSSLALLSVSQSPSFSSSATPCKRSRRCS